MQLHNEINTSSGDGTYTSSREVKESKEGIKVRTYGDAYMGYYYFQKDGDKVKVVRMKNAGEMINPTDGYQGAEQKLSKALYTVAWNYETESPTLLNLDKVSLINPILEIHRDEDLGPVGDYDFRLTFDNKKQATEKYSVTRFDKTDLTDEQKKALEEFVSRVDLEAYIDGGELMKDGAAKADPTDEAPSEDDDDPAKDF